MTKRHLVIATRESPLALKQTEIIRDKLLKTHPQLAISILGITTLADKRLDVSLDKIGGKGLFVKELEEALLNGRADIAVHSMKDVPMDLPPGLILPVIDNRADPRDVFISNDYAALRQLPHGSTVGTSSLRRQIQLQLLRPDIELRDLRGNVNTRLSKLDRGDYAAIVLAAAGVQRIGLAHRIQHYFSTEEVIPAAGQGALGIECREDDPATIAVIADLNDPASADCVIAERALCRRLNGGCQTPIGSFAKLHQDHLTLHGLVANQGGSKIIRASHTGHRKEADAIGQHVAELLLNQGAEKILQEFHGNK